MKTKEIVIMVLGCLVIGTISSMLLAFPYSLILSGIGGAMWGHYLNLKFQ